VEERGAGRPPGAVIVRARRRGTVIFGCLIALWLLALGTAESAQPTTSGRVGAAVIFGGLVALSVGSWFAVNMSRRRLEVGRDEIVIRPGTKGKPFTLPRVESDTLRILPRFKMLGAVRPPRLIFLGRGGFIGLRGFPLDQVKQACEAQGWRFDGDPSLAVADVQTWLHQGSRDVLTTRPRNDPDRAEQGVFSTRSPDRPNPIGLHRVRVVAVDGGAVGVDALEAVDGTPVLDLKPAMREFLPRGELRQPDWATELMAGYW